MTNTYTIRFEMDDLCTVEREYADTTPLHELTAEAYRQVERYATYDWKCSRFAIGFVDDEGNFHEIWNAEIEEPIIIDDEFLETLPEDVGDVDDFDEWDLELGFDPYEGCYAWDC